MGGTLPCADFFLEWILKSRQQHCTSSQPSIGTHSRWQAGPLLVLPSSHGTLRDRQIPLLHPAFQKKEFLERMPGPHGNLGRQPFKHGRAKVSLSLSETGQASVI